MKTRRAFRFATGFLRDRSGASALEFAIALPLLCALVFGLINVGMAFYSGSAVRNAVQRASRTLIANPATSASTVQAAATAMLINVPVQNLAVSISQETIALAPVKRVSWAYNYAVNVPFLPAKTFVFDSSLIVPMAS